MSRRQRLPARWPAATPTEPTPAEQLAHSALAAEALADGRIADACDLLDDFDDAAPLPLLAEIVAAPMLPDPAAWNVHDTNTCPVPADMLIAADLGDGCRFVVDRAGEFDWRPGCGPDGLGRVHRWARIPGAGRPT